MKGVGLGGGGGAGKAQRFCAKWRDPSPWLSAWAAAAAAGR